MKYRVGQFVEVHTATGMQSGMYLKFYGRLVRLVSGSLYHWQIDSPTFGWAECIHESEIVRVVKRTEPLYEILKTWRAVQKACQKIESRHMILSTRIQTLEKQMTRAREQLKTTEEANRYFVPYNHVVMGDEKRTKV